MVVPAMEAQGTIASLIKRRVQASTIAFVPPQTATTTSEPTGFTVRLTCQIIMYISTGHGGPMVTRSYRGGGGGGAKASCFVDPGSGEDGVRDALLGALRSIRAMQDLGLTDAEWESTVPEDVVLELADPEVRRRHGAAEVDLSVVRHVRYDAARMLMTGCRIIDDRVGVVEEDGVVVDVQCSVCFDALLHGEAVELPGCAHAFHRRCISKWFRQKPTCPLCRGDVVKHLHPELQKHLAEFGDAM